MGQPFFHLACLKGDVLIGRSRMKSDETTKSAGYAAIFGFNLRQLTRCLAGEVRPKVGVVNNIAANNANIVEKMNMQLA